MIPVELRSENSMEMTDDSERRNVDSGNYYQNINQSFGDMGNPSVSSFEEWEQNICDDSSPATLNPSHNSVSVNVNLLNLFFFS